VGEGKGVKVAVSGTEVEFVPPKGVRGKSVGEEGDNVWVAGKETAMFPSARDSERPPRMIPLEARAIRSPHKICLAIRISCPHKRGGRPCDWQKDAKGRAYTQCGFHP